MNDKITHPILDSLREDIEFYNASIKEVALEILDNDISECPIFIAHQIEINLGQVIMDKNDYNRNWTISTTIIEELIQKKIISEDKVKGFKSIFKDPRKYICVFLISDKSENFIFIPYKKESNTIG